MQRQPADHARMSVHMNAYKGLQLSRSSDHVMCLLLFFFFGASFCIFLSTTAATHAFYEDVDAQLYMYVRL
jgi:hypothetical protein